MGGLLVNLFYLLFWWLCSGVSKQLVNDNDPKAGTKRLGWFFVLAATPLYIYIYERSIYEVACWSSDDYYPREKIDSPKALLVYSESTAETYSKYFTGYMIAPERFSYWKTDFNEQPNKDEMLKNDFVIFHSGKKLTKLDESVKQDVANVRYGLFYSDEDIPLTTISGSRYYLYDFYLGKVISSVESFSKGWSQSNLIRSYLLPYEFSGCGPKFKAEYILKNTFKEWSGNLSE